jgi:hypothetical protein
MLVKEFAERVADYAKEIGCDGVGSIAAHKIKSSVRVACKDSDAEFELVGIDVDMLPGCGCFDGIVLEISMTPNDKAQGREHSERPAGAEG